METVTNMKLENRKLQRQLKEAANKGAETAGEAKSQIISNKVTQREVAALNVEHETLTLQVNEMKRFLEENEGQGNNDQPTGETNPQYVEELEEELQLTQQENGDLNSKLEEMVATITE